MPSHPVSVQFTMPPPEEKDGTTQKPTEPPVELENQFILRMPPTPAASLRAAVRSGVMSLKDRLTIQVEPDMRHGTVRFDKWSMSSKIVDLPCILESQKTLDRKNFYKTADICQMMVCKEEDDPQKSEEEDSTKKKKDKDKKFMWPHGITPSLKNVRKRRFRKTLKKKYVDFPEIEKEVKRLFRMDNEAISVRYEVVNADEDKGENKNGPTEGTVGNILSAGGFINSNSQSMDVAEHDLFGEVLSSSEEDDVNIMDLEDDEVSRASVATSNINETTPNKSEKLVTEFSRGMLRSPAGLGASDTSQDREYEDNKKSISPLASEKNRPQKQTSSARSNGNQFVVKKEDIKESSEQGRDALLTKLDLLEKEILNIQARRQAQELEISNIENLALKQRFQSIIDNLKEQEREKQRQYDDIVILLHQD
ncbi:transcription initiation factor TFIID subunit 7-like isoform X1 [Limulus polyphemus]|uniref:Transcription initiation factor TFIID subunit 7-like isoform X1 n=2 Tax=Limulus polyphemus TaxID=6850 RepID=A0ABM1B8G5_LIMPO|nr:transcription initiation factor TFIID subunit 7-like isoform X1 [Limulus polyphemus]